ncbi:MAG: archease [Candidatus Terrybacteria bacterium]|nr:archease [Candidatus Terrybacteria bacterium]
MNSFEILPHTADVRLRVKGKTLEALFKQAVLGMAQILKPNANIAKINANNTKQIKVESLNKEILLIDFLSEVLTLSQINKNIYNVSSLKFQDSSLEAELVGAKVDGFDEDIKAVTYHEAKITESKEGNFEVIITFDI